MKIYILEDNRTKNIRYEHRKRKLKFDPTISQLLFYTNRQPKMHRKYSAGRAIAIYRKIVTSENI